MSAEIFKSLRLLESERGIAMDFMLEKIFFLIYTIGEIETLNHLRNEANL